MFKRTKISFLMAILFMAALTAPASSWALTATTSWDSSYYINAHMPTSGDANWVTHYFLDIEPEGIFSGTYDAFCVEDADAVNQPKEYQANQITSQPLINAAWLMDHKLPEAQNDQTVRKALQVAIWEAVFDDDVGSYSLGSSDPQKGSFWLNDSGLVLTTADTLLTELAAASPTASNPGFRLEDYWFMSSGSGETGTDLGEDSAPQDYIIYQPVPEPATMLLFGTGLIGFAAYGRKKLLK